MLCSALLVAVLKYMLHRMNTWKGRSESAKMVAESVRQIILQSTTENFREEIFEMMEVSLNFYACLGYASVYISVLSKCDRKIKSCVKIVCCTLLRLIPSNKEAFSFKYLTHKK